MISFWRVGLGLLAAVMLSGAVGAQEPSQPRPLLMSAVRDEQFITGTDLYRLANDTWEAVTTDGYKGGFSLSPTGFIMAYQSVPNALRPVVEGGAGWLAGAVWDLRLLDLTTGESRLIAAQPAGFAVEDDGQIRNGVTRSTPVWSPDGAALAWTEQDYPATGMARLMVYDLVSGETRTLDAELPQVTMSADGLPRDLTWGHSDLVISETGVETLRFYDPKDGLRQVVPAPDDFGEAWLPLAGPLWVAFAGADAQVIVQAGPWLWRQVDSETGEITLFCGVLEQMSASSPDTSLRLARDTTQPEAAGEWRIVSADGEEIRAFEAGQQPQVVLSPQGERAAFPEGAEIMIYDGNEFVPAELPSGLSNPRLYWGWTEWRSAPPMNLECSIG
ncbi:MAG: hypothetical protein JNL34_09170 [Anaerolineae bacterium]|nr:hypothetical protein [Anaerolineae bacterium]